VQQESRTAASEVLRAVAAESVGRAGDEDRLLRERSHTRPPRISTGVRKTH